MGKRNRGGSGFSNIKQAADTTTKAIPISGTTELEQQAVILLQHGKLRQAEEIYRSLIKAGSNNATVYGNLAVICGKTGRHEEVITLLRESLVIEPNSPETHNNLGIVLRQKGDLEAAIAAYTRAIELRPNNPATHNNLGNALRQQDNLEAAIASYNKAIRINPNYPEAHNNLGAALQEENMLDAAMAAYNKAIQLKPGFQSAQRNLAMLLLLVGDYKVGWEKYELRHDIVTGSFQLNAYPKCPRWDGTPLQHQDQLLIISEQGLGDTLQFMRYALHLKNQGVAISICAPPQLHSLIQTSGIDPSPRTSEEANIVSDGRWIPMLSLPRHLEVTPENPIITEPYIKTRPELTDKWKGILANEHRPIIGINWQGNPNAEQTVSKGRSFPLETFAPIAAHTIATFLSLQKDYGSEQLETCSFRDRFVTCQKQVNYNWDFLETAAIIANCDLIITSDTSVAHLAGGMGKPTWLLLKQVPDWRWGREGNTSFWYPTMRLFRQKQRGNWAEVMERVGAELSAYFGWRDERFPGRDSAPPIDQKQSILIKAPISVGELVDKITILQIKTKHFHDPFLDNVKKELQALEEVLEKWDLKIDPSLIRHLKDVNADLWQIEDSIRAHERQKDFGETFIQLARSVYLQNDKRATIKREINTACGSAIMEEKSYQDY